MKHDKQPSSRCLHPICSLSGLNKLKRHIAWKLGEAHRRREVFELKGDIRARDFWMGKVCALSELQYVVDDVIINSRKENDQHQATARETHG